MNEEPVRRPLAIATLLSFFVLSGCNSGSSPQNSGGVSPSPPPGNAAPQIGGTPATNASVGAEYIFVPTASDADGDTLTFSINNAPPWITFNSSTGRILGMPEPSDVGSYSNVIISVTDGTVTTSLPAFTIFVTDAQSGSVTLTWTPPTQNTDGSQLTNLKAYKFYYGLQPNNLNNQVRVDNPGISTYVIDGLLPNTWYFGVAAVNMNEVESDLSNIASKAVSAN